MAGIGFRLQHLLGRGTYGSLLQAYTYSAVIAAGPWLLSIFGLVLISTLHPLVGGHGDLALFRGVVIQVYAVSLVLTGALQMGATRYLADRLFVGDVASLVPCYHALAGVTVAIGGALALTGALGVGLSLGAALAATAVFQAVALTWIGMVFLSAAKDYLAIARAFAFGTALAAIGAVAGARWAGTAGMLWGFAVGQALQAALLGARIRAEFPSDRRWDGQVFRAVRAMPWLLAIGVAYNVGIWADKAVFWCGPDSVALSAGGWLGALRASPRYDTCSFIAYVSVVPALALFLIRVEVAFYKRYAVFYAAITRGADLDTIMIEKTAMLDSLRLSIERLLKVQGSCTLVLVLLAPLLATALGMPADQVPLLRLCLIGAFLQVILQIVMVLMLYFDWQRPVALVCVLFLILNGGLSALSLIMGERWHGVGYVAACLISLVVALVLAGRTVRELEFVTFSRQPLRP